jgi:hypothetical protein
MQQKTCWPQIREIETAAENGNIDLVINFLQYLKEKGLRVERHIFHSICEISLDAEMAHARWSALHEWASKQDLSSIPLGDIFGE